MPQHFIVKPILVLFVLLVWINSGFAAPTPDLLLQWQKSDETNIETINHNDWQQLLDSYVSTDEQGINRVNYLGIIENDSAKLKRYVEGLSAIDPRSYSLEEQFAYWVNLYNASTVLLITDNYPVKSITKIKDGLFSFGPWDRQWLEVSGESLSLNDIEHRILRPIWKDNRIHYAVNCASLSCPNLSKTAFTSSNTEELLNSLAKDYINHPRGVNLSKGKLLVSSIYHWYADDFMQSGSDFISHLRKYAEPELLSQLQMLDNSNFKHDYDWELNEDKSS